MAWSAPRSPQAVALVLALWLLATANWALWLRLPHLEGYDGSLATLVLRLLPLGLGGILLLLSLTAWPRGMKPLWIALPWIAGSAQYLDRKSTRLNSSHLVISYAVFCLKK